MLTESCRKRPTNIYGDIVTDEMAVASGNENLVSAEGIESALKREFNNMQGHGWHRSTWNATPNKQTDCERIAAIRPGLTIWRGSGDILGAL
jgi:hypothetical protein